MNHSILLIALGLFPFSASLVAQHQTTLEPQTENREVWVKQPTGAETSRAVDQIQQLRNAYFK